MTGEEQVHMCLGEIWRILASLGSISVISVSERGREGGREGGREPDDLPTQPVPWLYSSSSTNRLSLGWLQNSSYLDSPPIPVEILL